ncbi:hypothetical protein D9613_007520 [Agrocybe pediades]|uniref:Uncharacterized protein n=1 Tax=Agrocybe pediades TaxID=84607 RepID=A0A8H4QND7_9AGAR|nr:hypothetical protein D9613_007520 [Agrocybe pediades]
MSDSSLQARLGPRVGGYKNLSWVRPGYHAKPHLKPHSEYSHTEPIDVDDYPSTYEGDYTDKWQPQPRKPSLLERIQDSPEPKSLFERIAVEDDELGVVQPHGSPPRSRTPARRIYPTSPDAAIRFTPGGSNHHSDPPLGPKSVHSTPKSFTEQNGQAKQLTFHRHDKGDSHATVEQGRSTPLSHDTGRNDKDKDDLSLTNGLSFMRSHISLSQSKTRSHGEQGGIPGSRPSDTPLPSDQPNSPPGTSQSHSPPHISSNEDKEPSDNPEELHIPPLHDVRDRLLPLILLNAEERLKQGIENLTIAPGTVVELDPKAVTEDDTMSFLHKVQQVHQDLQARELQSEGTSLRHTITNNTPHVNHVDLASSSTGGPSTMPQLFNNEAGPPRVRTPAQDTQYTGHPDTGMGSSRKKTVDGDTSMDATIPLPKSRKSTSENTSYPSASRHRRDHDTRRSHGSPPLEDTPTERKRDRQRSDSPSQVSPSQSRYNKRPRSASPGPSMAAPDSSYRHHRRGSYATTSSSAPRSPDSRHRYHHRDESSSYSRHRHEPRDREHYDHHSSYKRRSYSRSRDYGTRKSFSPDKSRPDSRRREYDYSPPRKPYQRRDQRYREGSRERREASPPRARRMDRDSEDERARRTASPVRSREQRSATDSRTESRHSNRRESFSIASTPPGATLHRQAMREVPMDIDEQQSQGRTSRSSLARPPDSVLIGAGGASRPMSLETSTSPQTTEEVPILNAPVEPVQETIVEEPMQVGSPALPFAVLPEENTVEKDMETEIVEREREPLFLASPSDDEEEEEKMQEPAHIMEEQTEPIPVEEEPPTLPCHIVPGFWFLKVALPEMGTLGCSFEIDYRTAVKWNITTSSTDNTDTPRPIMVDGSSVPRIKLQLCAFSQRQVQEAMQRLGPDPNPEELIQAIYATDKAWPPAGELIISVNPKILGKSKSFHAVRLGIGSAPVMIEDCVQEGVNEVRFIQLTGMPDTMFALYAAPRPESLLSVPSSR